MRRYEYIRAARAGAISGAILFVALIVAVFASGNTFGQRCDRAFPDNPARAETCVFNLSNGYAP